MPGGPHKALATACPLQGEQGGLGHRAPTPGGTGRGSWETLDFPCCSLRSSVLAKVGDNLHPQQRSRRHSRLFFLRSTCEAPVSSPPRPRAAGQNPDPKARARPRVTQPSCGSPSRASHSLPFRLTPARHTPLVTHTSFTFPDERQRLAPPPDLDDLPTAPFVRHQMR